jgi:hypothetical protein
LVALTVLLAAVLLAPTVVSPAFSALLTTLSMVLGPVLEVPLPVLEVLWFDAEFDPAVELEFDPVVEPELALVVDPELVPMVEPVVEPEVALLDATFVLPLALFELPALFVADSPHEIAKTHTDKHSSNRYMFFIWSFSI